MLDDTESTKYTHTLTVTGRLPGQYQCTVSNNKPSTANNSFTVQGSVRIFCDIHNVVPPKGGCSIYSCCTVLVQLYCCDIIFHATL